MFHSARNGKLSRRACRPQSAIKALPVKLRELLEALS
jgi:hypothetical protein